MLKKFQKAVRTKFERGQHADQETYDNHRTRVLEKDGFKVMRFWNNSIKDGLKTPSPVATRRPLPQRGEVKELSFLTNFHEVALRVVLLGLLLLTPSPLLAGGGIPPDASLSLWWAFPFVGMLLSLALLPLFASHFWEAHYGKVAGVWALVTILGLSVAFGFLPAKIEILGTLFHHYLPFVIMIGSLYTIAGGIQIRVESPGTPLANTAFLAFGTFLAGWIGTTGAAMLLIRPFLHMNERRKNRVHHMIFFIFLIANVGGALTPLGDPPLFLGFLNGVSFFWTVKFLSLEMLMIAFPLLLIFYALDTVLVKKEGLFLQNLWPQITLKGGCNGFLFVGVMGFVLMSGMWNPGISVHIAEVPLDLQNVVRDGGLILLAMGSYFLTSKDIHQSNHFSWEPLKEVIKLFFGIFVTVIPVIAILEAGTQGALAPLVSLVTRNGLPQNAMYFWLSGGLSSFLDNAPTYLVFFYMAGGEAPTLMSVFSGTLVAISCGSVFMGAMTYIGNAPNFMVKTIAEGHKIPMPSFFGYMGWSVAILLPLFFLLSWWRF
ncbi:MAG: sodium:proton antiporter [Proteobacteria bacterium]|nr:sodium:proton antiporter [Pseudomonadota bacterium]